MTELGVTGMERGRGDGNQSLSGGSDISWINDFLAGKYVQLGRPQRGRKGWEISTLGSGKNGRLTLPAERPGKAYNG